MNKKKIFFILIVLCLNWGMISCSKDSVSLKQEDLARSEEQTVTKEEKNEERNEEVLPGNPQQQSDSAVLPGEPEKDQQEVTGAALSGEMTPADPQEVSILIHIRGAVKAPGVYELSAGSRVYEAVTAAGGFADDADEDFVNLVLTLEDGCQLTIPTKEEVQKAEEKEAGSGKDKGAAMTAGIKVPEKPRSDGSSPLNTEERSSGSGQRVNINTAGAGELETLPGIGRTRASAIISYREANGGFQSIEEIMQVEGIKEGTFLKLKDQITVS